MRNIKFGALLIMIACFFIGCTSNVSDDWQTVSFSGFGTLKIPSEWRCYEEQDYIYIVDSNDVPIMIQSYSYASILDNEAGIVESNKYVDSIQCIQSLTDTGLSNGITYGKILISYDGEQREVFYLEIVDDTCLQLLILDKSLDEAMVRKIAKTYIDFDS